MDNINWFYAISVFQWKFETSVPIFPIISFTNRKLGSKVPFVNSPNIISKLLFCWFHFIMLWQISLILWSLLKAKEQENHPKHVVRPVKPASPRVTCHMSCITCQVSHVMCHVSHVMSCHIYFISIFFFTKLLSKSLEGLL